MTALLNGARDHVVGMGGPDEWKRDHCRQYQSQLAKCITVGTLQLEPLPCWTLASSFPRLFVYLVTLRFPLVELTRKLKKL